MKNSMYFSNSGITSTHAAFIKNVCKEMVQQDQAKLDNISVINSYVSLIGSESSAVTSVGVKDLEFITQSVENISKAYSLSAWLGEAIKAKDELLHDVECLGLTSYLEIINSEYPIVPDRVNMVTEEDLISEMSIQERSKYLTLEARAAQIGKLIHPTGPLSKARKNALSVEENPVITSGNGRDMTVTNRSVSIPFEKIEELFFNLQNEHRKAQSQLNRIKSEIKERMDSINLKRQQDYNSKYSVYQQTIESLNNEIKEYAIKRRQTISALKIAIPDELLDFYKHVDSMGK